MGTLLTVTLSTVLTVGSRATAVLMSGRRKQAALPANYQFKGFGGTVKTLNPVVQPAKKSVSAGETTSCEQQSSTQCPPPWLEVRPRLQGFLRDLRCMPAIGLSLELEDPLSLVNRILACCNADKGLVHGLLELVAAGRLDDVESFMMANWDQRSGQPSSLEFRSWEAARESVAARLNEALFTDPSAARDFIVELVKEHEGR